MVILGYSNNLAAYSIHLDEGALRTARRSGNRVAVLRMGLPVAFLGSRLRSLAAGRLVEDASPTMGYDYCNHVIPKNCW